MFHNRFTKDNLPWILTIQEYEIALLAARKVSRAKIAKQYHYSEKWVDKTMDSIYGKLMIKSRDKLMQYILS
jgi:DNA-binding CsgD family transcriptional regulator